MDPRSPRTWTDSAAATRARTAGVRGSATWSPRRLYRGRAARLLLRRLAVVAVALVSLAALLDRRDPSARALSAGPSIAADAYVVMDGPTGRLVAAHDPDRRLAVGSLTKLMTVHLALRAGEPDRLVAMPAYRPARDESVVGLSAGELQSRAVLVRAVLIVSAGDAAEALAVDISGTRAAFIDAMNREARRLGLTGTAFANPTGLDAPGQHSSARDIARLARRLMRRHAVRDAVVRRNAMMHGRVIPATNTLLGQLPGLVGVKTGHTELAGWNIAAAITRNGRTMYVVVLGAPSREARDVGVARLADWAFGPNPS